MEEHGRFTGDPDGDGARAFAERETKRCFRYWREEAFLDSDNAVYASLSITEAAQMLGDWGYFAESGEGLLSRSDMRIPLIRVTVDDIQFVLMLMDEISSMNEQFATLVLFTRFQVDNAPLFVFDLNDWNQNYENFGRASYKDDEENREFIFLSKCISLPGGVTRVNIRHNLRNWERSVIKFSNLTSIDDGTLNLDYE
jgi:hypothetical protein